MTKFYKVGGCVRDEILGRKAKDIDFSVEAESYADMRKAIIDKGGEIFLEQEQYLTIRAKIKEYGAADFVLCRKESHYTDGRHPESVTVGDIYDDLARRDFTMNAIAIDMDSGGVLDPYNGRHDIGMGIIKCVGEASDRFNEDRLRILRALRFSIQLGFELDYYTEVAILRILYSEGPKMFRGVSSERIQTELHKMFLTSTPKTLKLIFSYPKLVDYLFPESEQEKLWLMPTFKAK